MQETLILRSTTVEHTICQFADAGRAEASRLCNTAFTWSVSSSLFLTMRYHLEHYQQKEEAKGIEPRWDWKSRILYVPNSEKVEYCMPQTVDHWGPECEVPARKKDRCDNTYTSRPGWTVVDVRHGPHGPENTMNVDREPWDAFLICEA